MDHRPVEGCSPDGVVDGGEQSAGDRAKEGRLGDQELFIEGLRGVEPVGVGSVLRQPNAGDGHRLLEGFPAHLVRGIEQISGAGLEVQVVSFLQGDQGFDGVAWGSDRLRQAAFHQPDLVEDAREEGKLDQVQALAPVDGELVRIELEVVGRDQAGESLQGQANRPLELALHILVGRRVLGDGDGVVPAAHVVENEGEGWAVGLG